MEIRPVIISKQLLLFVRRRIKETFECVRDLPAAETFRVSDFLMTALRSFGSFCLDSQFKVNCTIKFPSS